MPEDDLPRGAGDPDFYGYPGEPAEPETEPVIPTIATELEEMPF